MPKQQKATPQRSAFQHRAVLIPDAIIAAHAKQFSDVFDPQSARIFFAIRALAQLINDHSAAWLAPLGIGPKEFNCLAIVGPAARGLTLSEISTLMHTSNANVTTMINGLERQELVVRSRNPSDGRSTYVKLTANGKDLLARAFPIHHSGLSRIIGGMPRRDRSDLLRLLVELAHGFGDARTASPLPIHGALPMGGRQKRRSRIEATG